MQVNDVKYRSCSCRDSQKLQNNASSHYPTTIFALCIYFLQYQAPLHRIHVFRTRRLRPRPHYTVFNGSTVFFIYHTCTTLQKKNEYKKEKKGGGNRIYNPRELDFCSGYGYRPHYNAENDHQKRIVSKTLSRVERFENGTQCLKVWATKMILLSENDDVTTTTPPGCRPLNREYPR